MINQGFNLYSPEWLALEFIVDVVVPGLILAIIWLITRTLLHIYKAGAS